MQRNVDRAVAVEQLREQAEEREADANAFVIEFGNLDALPSLDELERQYVLRVLDACDSPKIRAVRILGIDRKTLYRKLVRWGERDRLNARRTAEEMPLDARDGHGAASPPGLTARRRASAEEG